MTAQEDAAVLEVMIRGAQAGLVDFERMIVMRCDLSTDSRGCGH
jgi:purine nucleoside permease